MDLSLERFSKHDCGHKTGKWNSTEGDYLIDIYLPC